MTKITIFVVGGRPAQNLLVKIGEPPRAIDISTWRVATKTYWPNCQHPQHKSLEAKLKTLRKLYCSMQMSILHTSVGDGHRVDKIHAFYLCVVHILKVLNF